MERLETDAFLEFSAGLAMSFTQNTFSEEVSSRVPGLAGPRPQRHHLLVENTGAVPADSADEVWESSHSRSGSHQGT